MTSYEKWINREGYILYDPITDLRRKQCAILRSGYFSYVRYGGRDWASISELDRRIFNTENGDYYKIYGSFGNERLDMNDVFDSMPDDLKSKNYISDPYTFFSGNCIENDITSNWTIDHLRNGYCSIRVSKYSDDFKEVNCIMQYAFPSQLKKFHSLCYISSILASKTFSGAYEANEHVLYSNYASVLHFFNQLPESAKKFFQ